MMKKLRPKLPQSRVELIQEKIDPLRKYNSQIL